MSFSHLYYTSAKGQSHGFQVIAKSPNIDLNLEEDRIVKVSAYSLPQALKQFEHKRDIVSQAPRKFAYYQLKSGNFAMTNVTYLGKDYTGRTGNFFADTIVFDQAAFKGKGRPINYFGSASFKQSISEQEVEESTGYLEAVSSVSVGTKITFEAVTQFLSVPGRYLVYKQMLQAVIDYAETKKALIIVDDIENVAMWIGAIQYSFPEKLAWSIPFTTYTHQYTFDHPDAIIFGVKEEDVSSSWSNQFHVFDVLHQNFPKIDSKAYVNQIAMLMQRQPEQYEQFLAFVDLMTDQTIDESLHALIPLYMFIYGELDDMTDEQIAIGIDCYLNIDDQATLLALSEGILNKITVDENSCYDLYIRLPKHLVTKLTLKWMQVGKVHSGIQDLAVQFFYTSWESLMVDDRAELMTAELHRFADDVITLNEGNVSFHKKGYDKDRLEVLLSNIQDEGRQTLWETWIKYVLVHLAENQVAIEQANDQTDWLFEMLDYGLLMDFDFTNVLHMLFAKPTLVEHVLSIYLRGLHEFNDNDSLPRVIEKIKRYVTSTPSSADLYATFIAEKSFVTKYLFDEAHKQVIASEAPISDLKAIFVEQLNYTSISENDKDCLIIEAANTLATLNVEPVMFFKELEQLFNSFAGELQWARLLPVETNMELINRAIADVYVSEGQVNQYASIQSLFNLLQEYSSPKVEALRGEVDFVKSLASITVDNKLDSATLSKFTEQLKAKEPTQVHDLLTVRLPFFAQALDFTVNYRQELYKFILPVLEPLFVEQLMLVNEEQQAKGLASYIHYKMQENEELPADLITYLQGNRKLMKELEEEFSTARLKDDFGKLKVQVQGNNKIVELGSKFKGFFKLEGRKDKGNS